jgi:hypothetical protein
MAAQWVRVDKVTHPPGERVLVEKSSKIGKVGPERPVSLRVLGEGLAIHNRNPFTQTTLPTAQQALPVQT